MSYFSEAQSALDQMAYSFATGNGFTDQVAWENRSFTPTVGTPWMRATILPAETTQTIIGINGLNKLMGIYQVDLFYPVGVGSGTARSKSDDVITHFKRGTTATYSGVKVSIRRAWRGTALPEDDWYHIPINIEWYAYVENS